MKRASLLLALLIGGCGGSTGGNNGNNNPPPDLAPAGKPAAPTTLRSVESNAEGISDAAKVADWTKAQGILTEAQSTWAMLKDPVKAAGGTAASLQVIDDLFGKLTTDVAQRSQRAAETDANGISLAIPDLFDLFTYAVPSDVLRGDGVFRQLQIEGEYSDWAKAATDMDAVQQTWTKFRPATVTTAPNRGDIPGSATVVTDLDNTIKNCRAALANRDATATQKAAQDGLDFVDVVEQVFK